MEWLTAHHVVLDYFNNAITLNIPGKLVIRYQGDRSAISPYLISALTTRKLLAKGCQEISAYVLDTKMKFPNLGGNSGSKGFSRCFS